MPTTARNAAGKQAKETPKGKYQRPHRVHSDEEERIAESRHHQALVEEEANKRHVLDSDQMGQVGPEEAEEELHQAEAFLEDKKKRKGKRDDGSEEDDADDGEAAAEAAQAARKQGLAETDSTGRYFQDVPQDRLGDPSLTNPNEMKRVLGATSRFAQHAMLLAQSKLESSGARGDAVMFLAKFYSDLGDREYAKKALREFGPGTGIIDIYPLEVVEHLLQFVPSFFNNINRGRFFTSSTNSIYRARAGEPIHLTYPPELKIRGFAIKGGARPGYLLEPTEPAGTYTLTFQSGGHFQILISAIGRGGTVLVEEMKCEIEAADEATAFEEAAAIKRERAAEIDVEEKKKAKEKDPEPLASDLNIHLKQRI